MANNLANSSPEIIQFRELLTMFNLITEKCFHKCVESLNNRECTESESECVDKCTSKYSNFSAHIVPHFVTAYDSLIQKRVQEMEKANQEAAASALDNSDNPAEQPSNE